MWALWTAEFDLVEFQAAAHGVALEHRRRLPDDSISRKMRSTDSPARPYRVSLGRRSARRMDVPLPHPGAPRRRDDGALRRGALNQRGRMGGIARTEAENPPVNRRVETTIRSGLFRSPLRRPERTQVHTGAAPRGNAISPSLPPEPKLASGRVSVSPKGSFPRRVVSAMGMRMDDVSGALSVALRSMRFDRGCCAAVLRSLDRISTGCILVRVARAEARPSRAN
jgi:hypothetical protein